MFFYKNKFCILSIFTIFTLFGCGGESSKVVDSVEQIEKNIDQEDTFQVVIDNNTSKSRIMKAQLGVLANADVKIFRLEDNSSKTLLFSEKTSDGDSIDKIGNFNSHIDDLEPDKFYIYEVSGGVDKDVNNDAIIDDTPIKNRGKIRLISKGSMLKESIAMPRVTLASEMLYVQASKDIFYNDINLQDRLNFYVKDVLDRDIDGNGILDVKDILTFNPVTQKTSLHDSYNIDLMNHQILSQNLIYMSESNASYIIGSYMINGYYMENIALSKDETMIYTVGQDYNKRHGLIAINVADKTSPKYYNNLNTYISKPVRVTVSSSGKKVFVADEYSGLQIVDSSNPKRLKPFSSYDESSSIYDIVLSKDNTKAFISSTYYEKKSLAVIDIEDLNNPKLIGELKLSSRPNGLKLTKDESKIFSFSYTNLQIIDIDSYNQPIVISELNTTNYIHDIVLTKDEKKAFIAHDEGGILVVDISNLLAPKILTSLDAREDRDNSIANAYKIVLSKDEKRLFVAYYAEGVKIIDIQEPDKPKLIKTIKTPGYAQNLVLSSSGKILYVADESKGLQIIDVGLWSGE